MARSDQQPNSKTLFQVIIGTSSKSKQQETGKKMVTKQIPRKKIQSGLTIVMIWKKVNSSMKIQ